MRANWFLVHNDGVIGGDGIFPIDDKLSRTGMNITKFL